MDLNKEQTEAVNHIDGPLLVLAGAGSGKTRVVTYRISNLIEKGIPPSDILALTFTNKAAEEMKKRVHAMTQTSVLTCTFHKLGAFILRESIHFLGFKTTFTIYDSDDSLKLIKNCIATLGHKDEKGLSKNIQHQISNAKNNLLSVDQISSSSFSSDNEKIFANVFPLYQEKLKEYNAVDFDDLLYLPVKLILENQQMREFYQNRWSFVLIDEYQDTNYAQYTLSKILVSNHQNIFAVGDPDQSIYSWRGACYQNILNFDKDFPNAKTINLEQNYRSTKTILNASNALIQNNSERYEKNLWSSMEEGEKITLQILENEKEEAHYVVNNIIKYHTEYKIPLNETVIFYRTNFQSRILEDSLLEKKIPYVIYGGISFYQRKEIKDILAFMRLIVSDTDIISFERTINLPKRGIGKVSIQKLIDKAKEYNLSILSLLSKIINNEIPDLSFSINQKKAFDDYLRLIRTIRNLQAPIHEIISEIISLSNYLTFLKNDPETEEDKKENIQELIAKAAQWEIEKDSSSIKDFLENITLTTTSDDTRINSSLKLMSLHNGKGLEFTLVFIIGMEENLLPHINSMNTNQDIEEERRLFYVGMTRAKKILFLTASKYHFLWGSPHFMKPSRFINEIPKKFINNESKEEISIIKKPIQNEDDNSYTFAIGNKVLHKVFGRGTVKKAYVTSMGETYDVYFEKSRSIKSLVAKYAKLTPV